METSTNPRPMKGTQTMNMTPSQFGKALSQPYAWPGGYPTYFVTSDGAALCHKCAKKHGRQITSAIRDNDNSGWRVVAQDINWESNDLRCGHCSRVIETAYGEPEVNPSDFQCLRNGTDCDYIQ